MSLRSVISSIIRKSSSLIIKGKKYIKPGQKPPKGVTLHQGKRGGTYYFVEDKHLTNAGKEHELIRSRGVTRDQWKDIEAHYKAEGAESVHFVQVPGLEKDKDGNPLYNIYVRMPDTDKKLQEKKQLNQEKRKKQQIPEKKEDLITPEQEEKEGHWIEKEGIHAHPAIDRRDGGKIIRNGHYEVHPSGQFGAKLFHIDKEGKRHKLATAYEPVFGDKSETDINIPKAREKNIQTLKHQIKSLNPHLRTFLASEMERHDRERAEKPAKAPRISKNPMFELQQFIHGIRTGKVDPQLQQEQDTFSHEQGEKSLKDYFRDKLQGINPKANDQDIESAAQHALVKHTRATRDNRQAPLADAVRAGKNHLDHLQRHPRPKPATTDEIRNQILEDNPAINLSSGKTSAPVLNIIASWLLDFLDKKGYDAESTPVGKNVEGKAIFNITWKPKIQPKPPVQKPVSSMKKDSDYQSRGNAEKARADLVKQGFPAEVRERKVGKGTVYSVYRGKKGEKPGPSSQTAPVQPAQPPGVSGMTLTLPHDPGMKRAWVGKYSGIAHDPQFQEPLYDTQLLQPTHTGEDTKQFEFPGDGLYQAQGSGEGGRRYYQVSGGKVTQIYKQEWDREATKLPEADAEAIKKRMKNPFETLRVGGNTLENKDWIKALRGAKWNPQDRYWSVSKPSDPEAYAAMMEEFKNRGLGSIDNAAINQTVDEITKTEPGQKSEIPNQIASINERLGIVKKPFVLTPPPERKEGDTSDKIFTSDGISHEKRYHIRNATPAMEKPLKEQFRGKYDPDTNSWEVQSDMPQKELHSHLQQTFNNPDIQTLTPRQHVEHLEPEKQDAYLRSRIASEIQRRLPGAKPELISQAVKEAQDQYTTTGGQTDKWDKAESSIDSATRKVNPKLQPINPVPAYQGGGTVIFRGESYPHRTRLKAEGLDFKGNSFAGEKHWWGSVFSEKDLKRQVALANELGLSAEYQPYHPGGTTNPKPAEAKPSQFPTYAHRGSTINHRMVDSGKEGPDRYSLYRTVKEGIGPEKTEIIGQYADTKQVTQAVNNSVTDYSAAHDKEVSKRNRDLLISLKQMSFVH